MGFVCVGFVLFFVFLIHEIDHLMHFVKYFLPNCLIT